MEIADSESIEMCCVPPTSVSVPYADGSVRGRMRAQAHDAQRSQASRIGQGRLSEVSSSPAFGAAGLGGSWCFSDSQF